MQSRNKSSQRRSGKQPAEQQIFGELEWLLLVELEMLGLQLCIPLRSVPLYPKIAG